MPAHQEGPPRAPVDFGYKAQVVDNDDGIVLDHTVECGEPADAPQLAPPSPGSSPDRARPHCDR